MNGIRRIRIAGRTGRVDLHRRMEGVDMGDGARGGALTRGAVSNLTFGLAGFCVLVATALGPLARRATAQSLRGSPGTVDRQNEAARAHDFTFLETGSQVRRFVDAGYLIPVNSNHDYRVKRISFPYARPEVKLFVSRLGRQYRDACGEPLVVTSLTRPTTRQPRNASPRSVHPTGMAVDLRRSTNRYCREWLENVLLYLEGRGVLEAVRERYPPHYHVAVFPKEYAAYAESIRTGAEDRDRVERRTVQHRVRQGDTLWTIARSYGVSVDALRDTNDLRGSRIYPGQLLELR